MDTFKRTPLQLFNLPQHLVIPLFQRPYVWKEDEQWQPLWKDVSRVAELRIEAPHNQPEHFLGAVVLQASDAETSNVQAWNIIDGQQRLTTLQLLTDSASAVFAERGFESLAQQLEALTHNPDHFVGGDESRLKVRHLNKDQEAFDEVMTAEPPVDHPSLQHAGSRIVEAHHYFANAVEAWLGAEDGERKAAELAHVLQQALPLVTIELKSSENSQEIFETLNARGTPLTAADLIRNFVFQRLEDEGADVAKAYAEDWPFEAKFWAKEVSVGRHSVSRGSLFLNQWLVSRTGDEIGPQATFTRFKSYVEHGVGHKMADLLPVINEQAGQYEDLTRAAYKTSGDLTPVEMAVYRMQASGVQLLKPLIIWLYEPGRNVPEEARETALSAAESWMVRRQMLRLPSADLGRIVAEVIRTHASAPSDELGTRVEDHLARLNVTSTYWPGDDEVRSALRTEAVYRRYPRARLRGFLEAVENAYRSETGQPQVERAGFPIEHILPRKWQEHWPVSGIEAEQDRLERVDRLGNLTLLTSKLNSKVSNGPWASKRTALLEHNTIKLTGRLIEQTEGKEWNEALIDQRTEALINVLLEIWPVPGGHLGQVVDPQAKAQDWVQLKHLMEAGLLEPGATLSTTHSNFAGVRATLSADGKLEIDGRRFHTPSGAAKQVRGKATNGWHFWSLDDGRRLRDLRAEFMDGESGEVEADPVFPKDA